MKKMLLSLTAVCAVFTINAQVDTLTEFFTGTPTLYFSDNDGYVMGSNGYDDKGKYQRFDNSNGIGNGTMTGCLVWIAAKNDAGGTFNIEVRDFTGGTAGSVLASETVTIASVDTSAAGVMVAEGAVGYNVSVTFASPVNITTGSDVLVGISLPTTQVAGDTIGIISNTTGDYASAASYTWEQWSDDSWNDVSTAWGGLDIAAAIFPVVDQTASLTEASIEANVYPNPTSSLLNVNVKGEATSISILTMDGKVVATQDMNGTSTAVDVASLTSGVYFYEIIATDGSVVRNTFMKN